MRNAQSITIPSIGSSGSVLELIVPQAGNSPTIFDSVSGTMRIREGNPAVSNNLTSSRVLVSVITFKNVSKPDTPGSIKIEFTLTYKNAGLRNEYDYSKTFYGSATLH